MARGKKRRRLMVVSSSSSSSTSPPASPPPVPTSRSPSRSSSAGSATSPTTLTSRGCNGRRRRIVNSPESTSPSPSPSPSCAPSSSAPSSSASSTSCTDSLGCSEILEDSSGSDEELDGNYGNAFVDDEAREVDGEEDEDERAPVDRGLDRRVGIKRDSWRFCAPHSLTEPSPLEMPAVVPVRRSQRVTRTAARKKLATTAEQSLMNSVEASAQQLLQQTSGLDRDTQQLPPTHTVALPPKRPCCPLCGRYFVGDEVLGKWFVRR